MSRYLVINDDNMYIYLKDKEECLYKTNDICFNNCCDWLGKKCYKKCEKFKKEILTNYEN